MTCLFVLFVMKCEEMKESACCCYLALALPLQVDNTHVNNGAQIGECLHHRHI